MRPERDKRRGWFLIVALVSCGVLTSLHGRAVRLGRVDPVSGTVRDFGLVPGQILTGQVERLWQHSVGALLVGPRLARENSALSAQVMQLSAQNKELRTEQTENARLRQLLGFAQRSSRPLLAAQVAALKPSPHSDTLILNRGSLQGIHPRSVVLSPTGALVGQVLDVSPRSCNVLLLTDAGSSVGALVNNQTPQGPVGLCQGMGQGQFRVTYLRSDTRLQISDPVQTSGLGGVFPKGVPIGAVASISLDRTRSLQTAILRPAADFDHLEEVFVIQDPPAEPSLAPDAPVVP